MTEFSMLVNRALCFGCQTCEIACKQENHLGVGPRWIRVIEIGPENIGGVLKMGYRVMMCLHCSKPPCQEVCPTEAISKRKDGIVLLNSDLCSGCKACIEACPFGAFQWNPETKAIGKCTLCVHRIDKGLEPACVAACPTRAIHFGDINRLVELKRRESGNSIFW
jgi:Fe-S-cluster-containing dehydrogenase component